MGIGSHDTACQVSGHMGKNAARFPWAMAGSYPWASTQWYQTASQPFSGLMIAW